MQQHAAAVLLLAVAAGAVDLRGAASGQMQPDVAAQILANVEDEWSDSTKDFAACRSGISAGANGTDQARDADRDCGVAAEAFGRSCATITASVLQASSGDRSVVKEYTGTVCGQTALQGWKRETCAGFAAHLLSAMSADSYDNREFLNVTSLCQGFWAKLSSEEAMRFEKERAEREEEQKKLAEEAVEAAKTAEVEHERAEQEAKRAEAERKAEETKDKAEQAARDLEAKEEALKATRSKKVNPAGSSAASKANATKTIATATLAGAVEANATKPNATKA